MTDNIERVAENINRRLNPAFTSLQRKNAYDARMEIIREELRALVGAERERCAERCAERCQEIGKEYDDHAMPDANSHAYGMAVMIANQCAKACEEADHDG